VVFLEWRQLCNDAQVPVENIKYIVRINVIGQDMNEVLSHIAGGPLENAPQAYPGQVIAGVPASTDAHAVIGSSNGLGGAFFLLQHKQALGDRRCVQAINFYDSAEGEISGIPGLSGIPNVIFKL
jgi:hypothetical protein